MKRIPIGIQDFKELREKNLLYIDKTALIKKMVLENECVFFSRPRRFGKSLMLSTMREMFLGKKELFTGLEIENTWNWNEKSPVIHLQFNSDKTDPFGTSRIYLTDGSVISYQRFVKDQDISSNLGTVIFRLYELLGLRPAVIIDEYDAPINSIIGDNDLLKKRKSWFSDYYSGVKNVQELTRFIIVCGLTKIAHMSIFSGFNSLRHIEMDDDYSDVCGYSLDTILDTFNVNDLAKKNGLSYEECVSKMKKMYNGYQFGESCLKEKVFNPWAINNLFLDNSFKYFWVNTGIPSLLKQHTQLFSYPLTEMINEVENDKLIVNVSEGQIVDGDNIDAPLLLLYAGYLTLKKRISDSEFILKFPNEETEIAVKKFDAGLLIGKNDASKIIRDIVDLFYRGLQTENKDFVLDSFQEIADLFIAPTPFQWQRNNPEGYLKGKINDIFRLGGATILSESSNQVGQADQIMIIGDYTVILEAKVNESAKNAMKQIHDCYAMGTFSALKGTKLVFIGYNLNTKKSGNKNQYGKISLEIETVR